MMGFDVHVNVPADLEAVHGDRTAMGLVLDNVIDNAIRYSGERRSLRVTALNRSSNMEQLFRRDKILRQLSRVQRDVDFGVDAVEVVEHQHFGVVLGHGVAAVFGANEVDADYLFGVGGG